MSVRPSSMQERLCTWRVDEPFGSLTLVLSDRISLCDGAPPRRDDVCTSDCSTRRSPQPFASHSPTTSAFVSRNQFWGRNPRTMSCRHPTSTTCTPLTPYQQSVLPGFPALIDVVLHERVVRGIGWPLSGLRQARASTLPCKHTQTQASRHARVLVVVARVTATSTSHLRFRPLCTCGPHWRG